MHELAGEYNQLLVSRIGFAVMSLKTGSVNIRENI